MAQRTAQGQRPAHRGRVRHVEWLTSHMIRVVLGGDGLAEFDCGQFTDHYVKLLFPRPGVAYPEPFDLDAVHRDLPREQWPVMRTYTVRAWDPRARELTIDFVYHGDRGLAGPWAAAAKPGDEILFRGPGGAYAPDAEAGWHLLAGDESALPAIAASVERLPASAHARVLIEVADATEEQQLAAGDTVDVRWVHRDGRPVGAALVEEVRSVDHLDGDVRAFVHGEAHFVKELRRFLRVERGLPRERLSISGYWKLGNDEDAWQTSKAEWNRNVEMEEEAALTAHGD